MNRWNSGKVFERFGKMITVGISCFLRNFIHCFFRMMEQPGRPEHSELKEEEIRRFLRFPHEEPVETVARHIDTSSEFAIRRR